MSFSLIIFYLIIYVQYSALSVLPCIKMPYCVDVKNAVKRSTHHRTPSRTPPGTPSVTLHEDTLAGHPARIPCQDTLREHPAGTPWEALKWKPLWKHVNKICENRTKNA
jgi:hypothetical protein